MPASLPTLTTLLTALALTPADDRQGHFEILGLGNRTCAQYLIVRNPTPYDTGGEPDRDYLAWMHGYLTAFNKWVDNTYSIRSTLGVADLRTWVVQYCQQHPAVRFQEAIDAFTISHFRERQPAEQQRPPKP